MATLLALSEETGKYLGWLFVPMKRDKSVDAIINSHIREMFKLNSNSTQITTTETNDPSTEITSALRAETT